MITNVSSLIGGDGELYEDLKKRVEEKGLSEKIKLLGYRKDAYNILCGSDIVRVGRRLFIK